MGQLGRHRPEALNAILEEFADNPVLEQGIRWRPDAWRDASLVQLTEQIEAVAEISEDHGNGWRVIRRRHILELRDAHADPLLVFAGAMIWGFGPTGYGPYRTARVVQHAGLDQLKDSLTGLRAAALDGPAQTWDALRKHQKLRGLDIAFGTKIAYFMARSLGDPVQPFPLIADVNTSWGLWHLARIPRSAYRRGGYLKYTELAHHWAQPPMCPVDEIERALFKHGQRVRDEQRSRP